MQVELSKTFRFEAAHYLPQMPEGHKCRRVHGHSFEVEVHVKGAVNPETGILIDFADIKRHTKPYIDMLDHYFLNEVGEEKGIAYLKNPTSENIAIWLFEELKPKLPMLDCIVVHETCTSKCIYRGE